MRRFVKLLIVMMLTVAVLPTVQAVHSESAIESALEAVNQVRSFSDVPSHWSHNDEMAGLLARI